MNEPTLNEKKPNVFLETHDLDHVYREQCGCWSVADMNKFLQTSQGIQIPHTSCMFGMAAKLTQIARASRIQNMNFQWFKLQIPSTEKNLTITVNMDCVDRPCNTPDIKKCLNYIATGKCKDKFTIDLLGKTLFADKYQNQK